jgi:hypothetical protein
MLNGMLRRRPKKKRNIAEDRTKNAVESMPSTRVDCKRPKGNVNAK